MPTEARFSLSSSSATGMLWPPPQNLQSTSALEMPSTAFSNAKPSVADEFEDVATARPITKAMPVSARETQLTRYASFTPGLLNEKLTIQLDLLCAAGARFHDKLLSSRSDGDVEALLLSTTGTLAAHHVLRRVAALLLLPVLLHPHRRAQQPEHAHARPRRLLERHVQRLVRLGAQLRGLHAARRLPHRHSEQVRRAGHARRLVARVATAHTHGCSYEEAAVGSGHRVGSATESPQRHPQCASSGAPDWHLRHSVPPPRRDQPQAQRRTARGRHPNAHSSSRPPYWAAGGSSSAHANQPRRFPRRLKHYSDAGYINLLAPLALLPAATHARRTLRALVIGGGAGEVTKLPTARCSSVP
eukprot:scaffold68298_cov69-Phaeocystis_antarctica.AAC.5